MKIISPRSNVIPLVGEGGIGGVQVLVGISVGITNVGVSVAGAGVGVAVGSGLMLRQPARSGARSVVTASSRRSVLADANDDERWSKEVLSEGCIDAIPGMVNDRVNQYVILPW
jgi:hypothetical protein